PPTPTPFPYTTLFRSACNRANGAVARPVACAIRGNVVAKRPALDFGFKARSDPGRDAAVDRLQGLRLRQQRRSAAAAVVRLAGLDRKSTRLNSSHVKI